MCTERKMCGFDQCEANTDHSIPEPTERRWLAGPAHLPGWYWYCPECAEQIDEEAWEAEAGGEYREWNRGWHHVDGYRLGEEETSRSMIAEHAPAVRLQPDDGVTRYYLVQTLGGWAVYDDGGIRLGDATKALLERN